ncbi:putative transcription factor bZIP family [Helianthus annuus]|uniref:Endoplasmic reticulum transmembrane protein n=1 Tax=Helianthus annuus TaxID=4232 RepID=A0A251ULX8_HELAN|nr:B-cell receptor-associated protein 31 [Helianthus annuus]KAF5804095.1 putative transcription factor bZIP family [Helianthus annuus]KAJ0583045.1 putative transcription factor bZIP family [Helianthus annuus]KAJ0917166.1 putative transcription factor bZIP family [Helianthus annuus]
MIRLLFSLILSEMALIVIFVFKTPLRKLVIMGLDKLKRGRAPIVVKAVGSTIFVVMMSTVYSVMQIHNRRNGDDGELTPTDQILAARHLLEASLMGFSLFLALMIDRLHHYIRELRIRRKNMEAVKKQNRIIENGNNGSQDEVKALESELTALKEKVTHLESELEEKTKEASEAEAHANALKKQSEGFLLEYDRLLEDNQNLRAQLQSSDRR